MMQHIKQINILDMMKMYGEDSCKAVLSTFMCPLNLDVEDFIQNKAVGFARQRIAITFLVFKENENGYLEISKDCKFAVDIVEKDLPITIREKSIEMVRKLAEREINKKENKVEIIPENGYFKITMHVSDIDKDFMVLSLNVPTMAQAELIRDKFQQNPTEIYQNLINSIFN